MMENIYVMIYDRPKGGGDNVGYGTLEVEIKAHRHSKYESQDI